MTGGSISRFAKWRIVTLVFVHLLIAAHIIHWRLSGTTLASIQLSDAGRFAAEGVVTPALVFFALLLAATALFGRFFCAWGCHMLALQEVCRWLLGRVGLRPKLIRFRLLWLVPLYVAFYIFAQPALERAWLGGQFPSPRFEFTSGNLWANLPGPLDAVAAVLVAGFIMVYLLGALSFCKYVCPYGAVFALADKITPGRVRLGGECDGCARCTAACTTGVPVHKEVKRLGMVADSGCMRCLECVGACPQGVLSYGFGRPALGAGSRAGLVRYSLSFAEECFMVVLFCTSFFALHGLYDTFPLLVSLAASIVVGYAGVMAARVVRRPSVFLRGRALKEAGRLSGTGVFVVACAVVLLLFVGHSLVIQYHQRRAAAVLARLEFPQVRRSYSPAERELAAGGVGYLLFCTRYGVVDTVGWNMRLAWLYRVLAEPQRVEARLRRVIEIDPAQPAAHFNLAKELARQGREAEAAAAFAEAVKLAPALARFVPARRAAGGDPRSRHGAATRLDVRS